MWIAAVGHRPFSVRGVAMAVHLSLLWDEAAEASVCRVCRFQVVVCCLFTGRLHQDGALVGGW